jgi:holliday junction DNA helicase RuvA
MYEFIRGRLATAGAEWVVIDVHGVGYRLAVPASLCCDLPPQGEELLLYTSFVVREQSHTLYGFRFSQERDLFELLNTVSGVGPKIALALIGHLSITDFQRALRENDPKRLSIVKGVGKKTAERILIEMRDKLAQFTPPPTAISTPIPSSLAQDAISALMNLGHSPASAEKTISRTLENLEREPTDLATLLTHALRLNSEI